MKYSVRSLSELADAFELLAKEEMRKAKEATGADLLERDHRTAAKTWREAAAIVRATKLDI